jgi:Predicted integral membrane protein (DUF2269)
LRTVASVDTKAFDLPTATVSCVLYVGHSARESAIFVTKFLLTVHVLAAIITIGPVTVAASMFPAIARRARSQPEDGHHVAVLRTLHRISRVYAALGVVVPIFGLATAGSLHVLGDTWLIISIVLTAIAAAILALLVLPRQSAILAGLDSALATSSPAIEPTRRVTARLAMYTGVFNLLWATVTVLMILRPGSTTGA